MRFVAEEERECVCCVCVRELVFLFRVLRSTRALSGELVQRRDLGRESIPAGPSADARQCEKKQSQCRADPAICEVRATTKVLANGHHSPQRSTTLRGFSYTQTGPFPEHA
jgi:hypothetical protein